MAFVYVISASPHRHKVGISADPKKRLRTLQTGHPDELKLVFQQRADEPAATEELAHWALATRRMRGEWFNVTEGEAVSAVITADRALRGDYHRFSPGDRALCCARPLTDPRGTPVPGRKYIIEYVHPKGQVALKEIPDHPGFSPCYFNLASRVPISWGLHLPLEAANEPYFDVGDVV